MAWRKNLRLPALLAALIAAAMIFTACGSGKDVQESGIETPVGTLDYPTEWNGEVEVEQKQSDGEYTASFYAKVGDDKVELFELLVGATEGSYRLGSAPNKDGNSADIWLNIEEIEREDSWTDEEYDHINDLQSGVNDLIDQLNGMDGFKAES